MGDELDDDFMKTRTKGGPVLKPGYRLPGRLKLPTMTRMTANTRILSTMERITSLGAELRKRRSTDPTTAGRISCDFGRH